MSFSFTCPLGLYQAKSQNGTWTTTDTIVWCVYSTHTYVHTRVGACAWLCVKSACAWGRVCMQYVCRCVYVHAHVCMVSSNLQRFWKYYCTQNTWARISRAHWQHGQLHQVWYGHYLKQTLFFHYKLGQMNISKFQLKFRSREHWILDSTGWIPPLLICVVPNH